MDKFLCKQCIAISEVHNSVSIVENFLAENYSYIFDCCYQDSLKQNLYLFFVNMKTQSKKNIHSFHDKCYPTVHTVIFVPLNLSRIHVSFQLIGHSYLNCPLPTFPLSFFYTKQRFVQYLSTLND